MEKNKEQANNYLEEEEDISELCEKFNTFSINPKDSKSSDMIVNLPLSISQPEENPYLSFFKRTSSAQTPWRKEDITRKDYKKTIHEKADDSLIKLREIISKIIGDFESSDLEVLSDDTFNRLFEIIFEIPATTSVIRRIKTLPSIPKQLAKYKGIPKASQTSKIYSAIHRNQKQILKPEAKIAFGKNLPPTIRKITPTDLSKEWILSNPREDLFTMSTTFKGIENLTSTKEFCKWLQKYPDKIRPIYLEKQGFFLP